MESRIEAIQTLSDLAVNPITDSDILGSITFPILTIEKVEV